MSAASHSLVEAYLGSAKNRIDSGDLSAFLGPSSTFRHPSTAFSAPHEKILLSAFSPRIEQIPKYSASRSRSSRHAPSVVSSLVDGNLTPRPPRPVVSSAGASVISLDPREMNDHMKQLVDCLKGGSVKGGSVASTGTSYTNERNIKDCNGPTYRDTTSVHGLAYKDAASSNYCPSELSHATTPSWRSTSFPPSFKAMDPERSTPSNVHSKIALEAGAVRRRLPPLPDEATIQRSTPPSEVGLLSDIASDVHEANAMLVESFLNVKRRAVPAHGYVSCTSASSCSAAERSGSGSFQDSSLPSSAKRYLRNRRTRGQDMETLLEAPESCVSSMV